MRRYSIDDALALLERSRKRFSEFDAFGPGNVIDCQIDPNTRDFVYSLRLDPLRTTEARLIIADAANNLMSALDHIVAAIARANGSKRIRDLYFPLNKKWLSSNETNFQSNLKKSLKENLNQNTIEEICRVCRAVHKVCKDELPFVLVAKEISNTDRHWELVPSEKRLVAVGYRQPGGEQKIFNIPYDVIVRSGGLEFYRGSKLSDPIYCILDASIGGLDLRCLEKIHNYPEHEEYELTGTQYIFKNSFRFVEAVIAEVENAP